MKQKERILNGFGRQFIDELMEPVFLKMLSTCDKFIGKHGRGENTIIS